MNKFKMPSTESIRANIESSGLPEKVKRDALRAVDYSLAHPSSLVEAIEQSQKAIREREEIRKKNSKKPTPKN